MLSAEALEDLHRLIGVADGVLFAGNMAERHTHALGGGFRHIDDLFHRVDDFR